MRHLVYAAVLLACLAGTAPLELFLRARVYARWRRFLLALVPVVAVFLTWDVLAVRAGQWSFDGRQILGWWAGNLPIEEVAFFVVIPLCAVLTFEAVAFVLRRFGWAPDELGEGESGDGER